MNAAARGHHEVVRTLLLSYRVNVNLLDAVSTTITIFFVLLPFPEFYK